MDSDSQHNSGGRLKRVVTVPNIVSVGLGLIVFWIIASDWRSSAGTFGAAIVGGIVTGIVWI
ncbi:MAG: hypothetical protein QNL12_16035, partial [Acidimicrobiia bacterium]|nr:hypothetical protein [Acidimicrobiia bacterium]MDX2468822.1 hypothetical protein [Acidimicrobiia bacterium]